jgi:hypothetical protein
MGISDAAAGALNQLTFGLSNSIAGVDGSCAGFGYELGNIGGFAGSFFTGGGEEKVLLGAERGLAGAEEAIGGIEHGSDVLGVDLKGQNYVTRANPNTSYHFDSDPTRHGGPHVDLHIRRQKKAYFNIGDPWQFPG